MRITLNRKMRITLTLTAVAVYTFATIGGYEVFTQDNPSYFNGDGVVNYTDLSIVAYYLDDIE